MNNKRATKRALLTSVMALVMCVVMLVGTTFAWFTDTASTGVNKIVAGNLDVELLMHNGEKYVNISKEREPIFGSGTSTVAQNKNLDTLWEPGKTQVAYLAIENKGNLALKYKVALNVTNPAGGKDLYKVMQYAIVPDAKNDNGMVTGWTTGGNVTVGQQPVSGEVSLAVGATHYFALLVHMDEMAGNEYKNGKVDFDLTVYATQDTVENDSFNNKYDEDATYPVASAAEMKTALAAGGIVSVNKDIKTDNIGDTVADRVIISKPTTLNLDAKIISPDNMGNNNTNFCALIVDADTTINAGESGGIDTGTNGGYGINVRNGATLTINGGSYYGGGTAVQVQKGTLIINGGTFACEPFSGSYGYNFLINCIDSAYKNGTAKVEIKGGTFVNFDPSNCQAEGAGTNFVADGYKVVSATQTNGDTWYTVVSK